MTKKQKSLLLGFLVVVVAVLVLNYVSTHAGEAVVHSGSFF